MPRIKTEEEFIREFGDHWNGLGSAVHWNPEGGMDHLFGRSITKDQYQNAQSIFSLRIGQWCIYPNMVVANYECTINEGKLYFEPK